LDVFECPKIVGQQVLERPTHSMVGIIMWGKLKIILMFEMSMPYFAFYSSVTNLRFKTF